VLRHGVPRFLGAFVYKLVPLEAAKPSRGLRQFPYCSSSLVFPEEHMGCWIESGRLDARGVRSSPGAEYTLVEPQDHLKENVADLLCGSSKIRWANAAAGKEAGVLPLNVSAKDQSSSFLDYSQIKNDAVRKIEVPVHRNEIPSSLAVPVPEMLKIDAEGFDLRSCRERRILLVIRRLSSPKAPSPSLTLRTRPAI